MGRSPSLTPQQATEARQRREVDAKLADLAPSYDERKATISRTTRISAAVIALAVVSGLTPVRAASPVLADLDPIPLHPGLNELPGLAPNGGDAAVFLAWRGNATGPGYDLALTLTRHGTAAPWAIAARDGALSAQVDEGSDEITDQPDTGNDTVATFRFVRGKVDGHPALLVFVATRFVAANPPALPATAIFDVYELSHGSGEGQTPDSLKDIYTNRSSTPYCNADMALFRRFGLALRVSYSGPRTNNGC